MFEVEPVLSIIGEYPPREEEEIVRLLRLGRDYRELTQQELRSLIRSGMVRLVGARLSSNLIYPLERRLSEILDLDVRIDTSFIQRAFYETEDPLTDPDIITLGRYIVEDLYFNYKARILREYWNKGDLRLGHGIGLELQFPEEESIHYEYKMDEGIEEHRFMLKKEVQF